MLQVHSSPERLFQRYTLRSCRKEKCSVGLSKPTCLSINSYSRVCSTALLFWGWLAMKVGSVNCSSSSRKYYFSCVVSSSLSSSRIIWWRTMQQMIIKCECPLNQNLEFCARIQNLRWSKANVHSPSLLAPSCLFAKSCCVIVMGSCIVLTLTDTENAGSRSPPTCLLAVFR